MKLLRIKEEEDKKAKEEAEAAKAAKGGARATPKKPTKRRQPKPVEEEEEEEVDESWDWSERGIPDFENTDAYKRRNKKPAAGSSASPVSLSQSAREKMPSLDQFMEAIGINSGTFAIEQVVGTCFDMNFPKEAVQLFVDKVRLVCVAVFVSLHLHPECVGHESRALSPESGSTTCPTKKVDLVQRKKKHVSLSLLDGFCPRWRCLCCRHNCSCKPDTHGFFFP